MPKRDRFGLYTRIESLVLTILATAINASLQSGSQKLPNLIILRGDIELAKRLIRIANEIKLIEFKKYLALSLALQELSKMTNGWIKSLT